MHRPRRLDLPVRDNSLFGGSGTQPLHLAIGVLVSFAVGWLALWWVVRWLERGRLQYFAWWCIPVGIAVVVWQIVSMAT